MIVVKFSEIAESGRSSNTYCLIENDGCNASGTAPNLFNSYYASNQPLTGNLSGSRWFWTNTLGTVWESSADDFDAEDVGNAKPTVGQPIQ